jgi:hypothetical protein
MYINYQVYQVDMHKDGFFVNKFNVRKSGSGLTKTL